MTHPGIFQTSKKMLRTHQTLQTHRIPGPFWTAGGQISLGSFSTRPHVDTLPDGVIWITCRIWKKRRKMICRILWQVPCGISIFDQKRPRLGFPGGSHVYERSAPQLFQTQLWWLLHSWEPVPTGMESVFQMVCYLLALKKAANLLVIEWTSLTICSESVQNASDSLFIELVTLSFTKLREIFHSCGASFRPTNSSPSSDTFLVPM